MSEKTLADVARDAYDKECIRQRDAPESVDDTRAWEAAAQAVVDEVLPRPVIDDLDARMLVAVAQQAVIEAAAKWLAAWQGGTMRGTNDANEALVAAVEALQEARDE